MDLANLQAQVAAGEDSGHQFKLDMRSVDALGAEIAAMANSDGGLIYLGVGDDGSLDGLPLAELGRINQLISNAASQHVRSPVAVRTSNVAVGEGRVVVVLEVPKGLDKPYFDKSGVIWLKVGADKRRVNSKEELRRMFALTDQFHADELPTQADAAQLDKLRLREFLQRAYQLDWPELPAEQLRLLQNMNLVAATGALNLSGLLLFGLHPQRYYPQFVVKAATFAGAHVGGEGYQDSADLAGPLRQVFDEALAFVMRNLRRVQAGQSVNSVGVPEVPLIVFEELLVNALIHRDYLVSAPVRLLVFDDRIEIISPGNLPNNLTVAKVLAGNTNIRNPILTSFAAKGVLPYRGLGSGILRAVTAWPRIELTDDREAGTFVAVVRRVT